MPWAMANPATAHSTSQTATARVRISGLGRFYGKGSGEKGFASGCKASLVNGRNRVWVALLPGNGIENVTIDLPGARNPFQYEDFAVSFRPFRFHPFGDYRSFGFGADIAKIATQFAFE